MPYFSNASAYGISGKLRRHRLAAAEFLEHPAQHRLDGGEHVFLGDEAHLDVELVEFAGAAVGARVLVAEAGRDLEIAVEPGHHDELLELLGRLRQRVELARMEARGHEEVARAFGARGGEDRRLELEEPLLFHPSRASESMICPRSMMFWWSFSRRRSRKRYRSRVSSG